MSCEKLQDPFSDEEDSEEEECLKKDGWLQNERDSEMVIARLRWWKGHGANVMVHVRGAR